MLNALSLEAPAIAWFVYDRKELPNVPKKKEKNPIWIHPIHSAWWDSEWIEIFLQHLDPVFAADCRPSSFKVYAQDTKATVIRIFRISPGIFDMELSSFDPRLFATHSLYKTLVREMRSGGRPKNAHCFAPSRDLRDIRNLPMRANFCTWYLKGLPEEARIYIQRERMTRMFSKSTIERFYRIVNRRGSLEEVLATRRGTTIVNYLQASEAQFKSELSRENHRFCWIPANRGETDQFRVLSEFMWKVPWADSAAIACDYLELDASFYCFQPYVFCIPQAIVCNISIPLGISIGDGEVTGLYERFYQMLSEETRAIISPREKEGRKFCLSDEGSALQSFCGARFNHVLCHHHILQGFGSSPVAVVVNQLITAATREEFEESVELANAVVEKLLEERGISQANLSKYEKIAGFTRSGNEWEPCGAIGEEEYQKKVLLFWRGVVARCSNHSESIHRACKEKARNAGKRYGFLRTLAGIMDYILELPGRMIERARRLINDAFKKVKTLEFVSGEECCCRWAKEMPRRWAVEARWPCIHTPLEDRKSMKEAFLAEVCAKLTAFLEQLRTTEGGAQTFNGTPFIQIGPLKQPTATKTDYDAFQTIPETPPLSKALTPQQRIGVTLSRWFQPVLHEDRDELTSKCTSFAIQNDYSELTADVLIRTFNYVHKKHR